MTAPIAQFIKDPAAVLDYEMNWSTWLAGDVIESAVFSTTTGLQKVSETFTNTTARVWIGGGTEGTRYDVTCQVTTTGGRTDRRTFRISVKAR